MKTLFITLVSLLSLATAVQAQTVANSDDVSAVKKIITDETDAFFTKDREKWASQWAHEPYVSWTAQGGATNVLTKAGWDAYSSMFEGYFSNPEPSSAATFLRENMQVTVLDKVATVSFLQTRQRASGNLKSREVRVLEKQGADWKLVSVYSRNME